MSSPQAQTVAISSPIIKKEALETSSSLGGSPYTTHTSLSSAALNRSNDLPFNASTQSEADEDLLQYRKVCEEEELLKSCKMDEYGRFRCGIKGCTMAFAFPNEGVWRDHVHIRHQAFLKEIAQKVAEQVAEEFDLHISIEVSPNPILEKFAAAAAAQNGKRPREESEDLSSLETGPSASKKMKSPSSPPHRPAASPRYSPPSSPLSPSRPSRNQSHSSFNEQELRRAAIADPTSSRLQALEQNVAEISAAHHVTKRVLQKTRDVNASIETLENEMRGVTAALKFSKEMKARVKALEGRAKGRLREARVREGPLVGMVARLKDAWQRLLEIDDALDIEEMVEQGFEQDSGTESEEDKEGEDVDDEMSEDEESVVEVQQEDGFDEENDEYWTWVRDLRD